MKSLTFGGVVKKKRKELRLTAERLADRVGVDRTYISKIENKDFFPSLQVYAQIATILKIKLSDFPCQKYIKAKDEFLTELSNLLVQTAKTPDSSITKTKRVIINHLLALSREENESGFRFRTKMFLKNWEIPDPEIKVLIKEFVKSAKKLRRFRIDFNKKMNNEISRVVYSVLKTKPFRSPK